MNNNINNRPYTFRENLDTWSRGIISSQTIYNIGTLSKSFIEKINTTTRGYLAQRTAGEVAVTLLIAMVVLPTIYYILSTILAKYFPSSSKKEEKKDDKELEQQKPIQQTTTTTTTTTQTQVKPKNDEKTDEHKDEKGDSKKDGDTGTETSLNKEENPQQNKEQKPQQQTINDKPKDIQPNTLIEPKKDEKGKENKDGKKDSQKKDGGTETQTSLNQEKKPPQNNEKRIQKPKTLSISKESELEQYVAKLIKDKSQYIIAGKTLNEYDTEEFKKLENYMLQIGKTWKETDWKHPHNTALLQILNSIMLLAITPSSDLKQKITNAFNDNHIICNNNENGVSLLISGDVHDFVKVNHANKLKLLKSFLKTTLGHGEHEDGIVALILSVIKQDIKYSKSTYSVQQVVKHGTNALTSLNSTTKPIIKDLLDETRDPTAYQDFLKPLIAETTGGASKSFLTHKNFVPFLKKANEIFMGAYTTASKDAVKLHKELKENFNSTPKYDKDTGLVTCDADTLSTVLDAMDRLVTYKRIKAFAFDYPLIGIQQKKLYAHLVQIVLCGDVAAKAQPPKSTWCLKVTSDDSKGHPDTTLTACKDSYIYTEFLNDFKDQKTFKDKFLKLGVQYAKDALERGKHDSIVVFINKKEPVSHGSEAIKTMRDAYEQYLLTLSKSELQTIIEEDSNSEFIKAAREAFEPKEKIENDVFYQDSAFPESILMQIMSVAKKDFNGITEMSSYIDKVIPDSSLDQKTIDALANKTGLNKKDIEPLARYKALELMLTLGQSTKGRLTQHASEIAKLNNPPENPRFKTRPTAPVKIELSGNRYENLMISFGMTVFDENNSDLLTVVKQEKMSLNIKNISQNSSGTFQVLDGFLLCPFDSREHVSYIASLMQPDTIEKALDNQIEYLKLVSNVYGGDTLKTDANGKLIVEKSETFLGWMYESYQVPTSHALRFIKEFISKMSYSMQVLDGRLSIDEKKENLKKMIPHIEALGAFQNQLDKMMTTLINTPKDQLINNQQGLIVVYYIISSHRQNAEAIIEKWNKETQDHSKLTKQTPENKDFIAVVDTEKLRAEIEAKPQETINILSKTYEAYQTGINVAYEAYQTRFTEKAEEVFWKTEKYDKVIHEMQKFVEKENDKLKSSETLIKELASSKSTIGKALKDTLDALMEIKVDPKNRPTNHKTDEYQKGIRTAFQKFFGTLTTASKEALTYLEANNQTNDDRKYANLILAMCSHFFNGINLKKEAYHAVEAFSPLNIDEKTIPTDKHPLAKFLEQLLKGTFDKIKKADACKKTPMHHGIGKSLIGHFNIGFNSWFSGNPSQELLDLQCGDRHIKIIGCGCPTNEPSPGTVEVISPLQAAMEQYGKDNEYHLYISLQNAIPVDAQGWKTLFKKLPDWLNNWAQAVVGGDETNRIKALIEFEKKKKAFYFMNLAKNSPFYNNPVDIKKVGNFEVDQFQTTKNFKEAFLKQIFADDYTKTGTYISQKIKDAYSTATGKSLKEWSQEMVERIHKTLFPDTLNKDYGKDSLPLDERRTFIDTFYQCLSLEIAQELKVKTINYTCKDGIDRAMSMVGSMFAGFGVINSLERTASFLKDLVVVTFSRALFARQREIIDKWLEAICRMTTFAIDNKEALTVLHKETWPKNNGVMQATLIEPIN